MTKRKDPEDIQFISLVDLAEMALKDNLIRHGQRAYSMEQARFAYMLPIWSGHEYTHEEEPREKRTYSDCWTVRDINILRQILQ